MPTLLLEWNLGFSFAEVVEGLEKMCSLCSYPYTRVDRDSETSFSISLPTDMLTLSVKPFCSSRSPFSSLLNLHRTLLSVASPQALAPHDWKTFRQHLTLAFLRAGG